ncbi:hypothetical protein KBX50_03520 [Micromonospora sp. C51]|uniref:condensation domain-containing protein n=1 Tax=Micromonospora sp. C51 TaxID=2824879 RepID=UPI001B37C23A|nr:condensation domain-containing protein [Micromonospora sp. C51]MBQ1047558.1 hypothetical protein [Micromonospora sp. C51]
MSARVGTAMNIPPPIRPVPRTGVLRLSPGQERLWFLDRLHSGGTGYLIRSHLRLRGAWDPAVFERAVAEVVRRHEVLRTRYEDDAGDPVQVVDPPGPADVTVVDLTGDPVGDPHAATRAAALLDAAAARPFDLRREHPLRVVVVRLAPTEHLVGLTLHHIAADGWSCDILMRELDQAYRALATGRPQPPPPPVQYADVAAWQRSRREATGTSGIEYWRDRLAGLDPVILPTDRRRDAGHDRRGEVFTVDVPRHVARLVDAIGERHGTTAFMTLLAAFKVLLAHRTGRTDIAVGLPDAGRDEPETEDLIGFFINTLVLRTDLSGGPSFVEVLHRVRETVLSALMHNDVPFEDVVAAVRPGRDPARNPLFDIMFQVIHTSGTPGTLGGAAVEPLPATATAAKFDLVFTVYRTPAGDLQCMLEYAAGLFDRTTMQWLAEDYVALLERLAGAPQVRAVQPAPAPGAPTTATTTTTQPTAAPVSPSGPVEQAVAGIWSALLDVDDIAADDEFFDLGGNSLLVIRVRAALRRTFAVDLPVQVLFEAVTVAELAAAVTAAVRADVGRMSTSQVQGVLLRAAPKGTR